MPIYEYRCSKCRNVFEVLQKFSDTPLKKHEKCGGKVERLISASGFHLKGGGWYVTDYGKGGVKQTNSEASSESNSESKPAAESKSDTKAETKTETKTETKAEKKTPAKKD
jgi:putative FmdB family regulatory protein